MITIHKFKVPIQDVQEANICGMTRLLDINYQDGDLCIWALVNTDALFSRQFKLRIVGTGHIFDDYHDWSYWKTVFMGPLVWHVYVNMGHLLA